MKKEVTNLELLNAIQGIETRLDAVGKAVYETRDIVSELLATRDDHEVRISTLERSNTRLRLLIDR